MRYLTTRKRAEGLGSARSGTEHHMAMTTSGWALLVLVPVLVFVLARTIGGSFDEVRATFANPFVAILTALFLVIGMRHFAKGAHDHEHSGAADQVSQQHGRAGSCDGVAGAYEQAGTDDASDGQHGHMPLFEPLSEVIGIVTAH